jgi:hypothetical protein
MQLSTLSDLFDTKLNTYEGGVEKDEYEKSLYLTTAQDMYYDAILKAFEETNTVSEQIDRLLKTVVVETFTDDLFGGKVAQFTMMVRKVLREKVLYTDDDETIPKYQGKSMQVREERLSEIESSLKNPFRTPGEHYVLRAIEETTTYNKVSLYIPPETAIAEYTATLATEPPPIILEDLPDGLSIRGLDDASPILMFKDKDLDKITEIAVSLVLKDMGVVAPQQQPEK